MSEFAVHFKFKTTNIEFLESVQKRLPASQELSKKQDYWVSSPTNTSVPEYAGHIPYDNYESALEFAETLGKLYAGFKVDLDRESFLHVHKCGEDSEEKRNIRANYDIQ